ncbi:syndecan isoform X2 [Folsomia candida]|uniref:syndecan isoform X2 n=1 Tax=Folsomia candida TaxID=158441 RepID=UPI0016053672|nr:syndecan isoform X2 [Folsomia candida]
MAHTRRLLLIFLVSLCLARSGFVIAGDIDGLSSKIDQDLFLEDEGSGVGSRGMDDLEISGSGNGDDDEDTTVKLPPPPKTTPKSAVGPIDITETGKADVGGDDINFPTGEGTNIFNHKEDTPASFFSQPGILAAIICGAIVGLLCAILLVMFVVYRMRKKDEGQTF